MIKWINKCKALRREFSEPHCYCYSYYCYHESSVIKGLAILSPFSLFNFCNFKLVKMVVSQPKWFSSSCFFYSKWCIHFVRMHDSIATLGNGWLFFLNKIIDIYLIVICQCQCLNFDKSSTKIVLRCWQQEKLDTRTLYLVSLQLFCKYKTVLKNKV